jgi:hypothetical protein
MKVSELSGLNLDWAVAICEGYIVLEDFITLPVPRFSENWSLGGEIIERIGISIKTEEVSDGWSLGTEVIEWSAYIVSDNIWKEHLQTGETPLIAAMRCYVASKLGDEINIPEEL